MGKGQCHSFPFLFFCKLEQYAGHTLVQPFRYTKGICSEEWCIEQIKIDTIRARSKQDQGTSRENMRSAASLRKKRQTLSLPPTCTQLVLCEKGKFSLDGSFSKNAPYKQKIIFHLTSIGKMSRKKKFLGWQGGGTYQITKVADFFHFLNFSGCTIIWGVYHCSTLQAIIFFDILPILVK